jgi:hypothetical protein
MKMKKRNRYHDFLDLGQQNDYEYDDESDDVFYGDGGLSIHNLQNDRRGYYRGVLLESQLQKSRISLKTIEL